MTVRSLPALPPGSPEWHKQRARRLGGSDVAAALNLSPWRSRFALWHEKRGELGHSDGTESMRWGTLLEPVILAEYLRRSGLKPSRRPACWGDDWRIASPDMITTAGTVIEAKTADGNTAWEWGPDGSDDPAAVPIHYRIQCLWYIDVIPRVQPWATLVVLLGGNDLRSYTVAPEPGEIVDIRWRARLFHRSLKDPAQRPTIDSSASTYQAVRELHPDIDGTDIELDPDDVQAWQSADLLMKDAKADRDEARSRVADLMGIARYGCVHGERVVRRQTKAGAAAPWPVLIPPKKDTP